MILSSSASDDSCSFFVAERRSVETCDVPSGLRRYSYVWGTVGYCTVGYCRVLHSGVL
jgi:hypothetical protein